MPQLPASVLLGIVLASGIGALIVCALLLRYGHLPEIDETPRSRARRLFVTRIGHATAVICFAVCALLALAALGREQRAARAQLPLPPGAAVETERLAGELREQTARLRADVDELTARVSRTEARGASSNGRTRPSARVSAAVSAPKDPVAVRGDAAAAPRDASPARQDASAAPRDVSTARRDASPAVHDSVPAPSRPATPSPEAPFIASAPRPAPSVPATVSPGAEPAPASPAVETPSPNVSSPRVSSPQVSSPDVSSRKLGSAEAPPAARACGGEASARSRGAVVADCVQDWVKGEAREFRDGVRREIGEFRNGFARVRQTLADVGAWLRGEEDRSDR
jgi:hypothetical protein